MKCEICNKEHDGSFQSGRFCSIECKTKFIVNKVKNIEFIKCNKCGKEIKKYNLKRHQEYHDKKTIIETERKNKKYNCEVCNNVHNGNFGSGRFCSKKCASIFSSNNNRKETNEKISKKLKGFKFDNGNKIKIIKYCISCNQHIESRSKYCKDCKNFCSYQKLFKKLNINDTNLKIANNKSLKLLKEEYFDNELSLLEIREKYGIQLNTVHFYFKKNGISLRELGESISLSYKNGKSKPKPHGPYKEGYHATWDNKQVYLRSSYEFNYAKQLDDYKIRYEVENIRIRYYDSIEQKERTSIPDFYLPDLNMLVEIKSNYTINVQNMKDKFKEYKKLGYKTKLILEGKDVII